MHAFLKALVAPVRSAAVALWGLLAPHLDPGVPTGVALDAARPRRELVLENALLRQQIIILRRKNPTPRATTAERFRLLVLAALVPSWRRVLVVVQPETLLRWHRQGFPLLWRRRSRHRAKQPRVAPETVNLIREMAVGNPLWGAERIRGELLKLDVRISKRTVQKYMRGARPRRSGQRWSTFLKNHSHDIWSCDFIQSYDLLFRPVFLFFLLELGSRRVVHIAATRNPTQNWTAQQLRNATMDGVAPKHLVRDRDDKFGSTFDRVAEGAGIEVIKTAPRAPNMNAVAERFVGSVRRELLDHVFILGDEHLRRIAAEYARFFNQARPHQGIGQRVPAPQGSPSRRGQIIATPVLGGLHHDYRRAA